MKYCPNFVTTLEENQVFVFGSNNSGFHGAGSAGYAQRGTTKNTWRTDECFLAALKTPLGDFRRRGVWAELGVGRGFQQGVDGKSYAIATVTRPGARRSISLKEIYGQLIGLGRYAFQHPEWEFLTCIVGGGYNGWSVEEIQSVYRQWCDDALPASNILFRKEYEFRTSW